MQKDVYIENIGTVLFRRQSRYVRMSMRISQEGNIVVNIPALISFYTAYKWVLSKTSWINSSRKKIIVSLKQTIFTFDTEYKTYKHTICIVEGNSSVQGNIINIGMHPSISRVSIASDKIQLSIRKLIDEVYTQEAKEILPIRICKLADKYNFIFNKLSFRNNKSRWGSCSGEDNISLNIHLMRLPNHLIDYVLLHELSHTIEKNHSIDFWDLLESVCPKSLEYRKELRAYSTTVY